ncbi:hypothetical protein V2H45_02825 [Tumidithrix elongata RA019]|uniref:Uncharacterized protein n=1 Tax=Tumidithrix elongata BACA0141 TaxID=2716417 RepID=A0AAW9PWN7_9CYAN|nr:hypothetical protein [Tumidithrix elongata RA019]
MIPVVSLLLAFSVTPSTIASVTTSAVSMPKTIETLDRVSDKFTARSLAGEYTLATIPQGFTTFDDGTPVNFKFSLWLNSDRTFESEIIFISADPERSRRSPVRLKAKGEFYLDGNSLQLLPKEAFAIGDRNRENISAQEIEFVISPNGQVLQQVDRKGIFLVKK